MRFVSRGLDLLHFGSRIPEDGRWSKAYKRNEAPCRIPAGNPDGGRFASCEGMAPATRGPDGWQMADGSPLPDHAPKNIPPAWREVVIATDPEADLLVKGIDAKGRTQSVYSDNHTMRAAAAKFARVNELRAKQDEIDAEIARDLTSGDRATREAAAALRLIRATGLRPGGEGDTGAEKQAYGATTLEGRHIKTSGGGVRLQFTGKKGVDLDIPVLDKAVAADLKERKLSAGAKKKVFDTDASALRDYTAGKDGGGFKPKDFRTAKGTSEAIAKIKKTPTPKDEKEYKKAVREVAKHVSEKLGNTPAIALQSYIDPTVFAVWRAKAMKKGSKAVEPCRIPAGNPEGGQFAPCDGGAGGKANTDSPEFKNWFGDWKNYPKHASKVVGADGKPKETHPLENTIPAVVYHGTIHGEITEFDKAKQDPTSLYGPGFYFTEDKAIAAQYAAATQVFELAVDPATAAARIREQYPSMVGFMDSQPDKGEAWAVSIATLPANRNYMLGLNPTGLDGLANEVTKSAIISVHLNIRNPFDADKDTISAQKLGLESWGDQRFTYEDLAGIMPKTKANTLLKKAGYDGITHIGVDREKHEKKHRVWIAFDPTQIKSAENNNGNFDPTNPNINKSTNA